MAKSRTDKFNRSLARWERVREPLVPVASIPSCVGEACPRLLSRHALFTRHRDWGSHIHVRKRKRDRERDRERQRETERDRERQRETERERQRERQRETERDRERQRETERDRERQREKERQRDRDRTRQDKRREERGEKPFVLVASIPCMHAESCSCCALSWHAF